MVLTEMDKLRTVLQALSLNGEQEFTNILIYKALNLKTDAEKTALRSRLRDLIKGGEVERVKESTYIYKPKVHFLRGDGYGRMWKIIRASSPTFKIAEVAALAHVEFSFVSKYCRFLLEQGFLSKSGKSGQRILYAPTKKARDTIDTPYPPRPIRDPFAAERKAMSNLARIFFEEDLYQPGTQNKILKHCRTITGRFEKDQEES